MGLSIIGAGFGRTGTLSMKLALEALGLGPCHHMADILSNPDQLAKWREVAQGGVQNWDDLLSGYNSAIDWPSAYYWRELAEHCRPRIVQLQKRRNES
jgi:Sulfotransferase domain